MFPVYVERVLHMWWCECACVCRNRCGFKEQITEVFTSNALKRQIIEYHLFSETLEKDYCLFPLNPEKRAVLHYLHGQEIVKRYPQ